MALSKLTQSADFTFVYRQGKRLSYPWFVVRYVRGGRNLSKFAVVASVKQVGKAVKRNRARRRVWQAIKKHRLLYPSTGYLIVFILKKSVVTVPWKNLLLAVGQAGERLH